MPGRSYLSGTRAKEGFTSKERDAESGLDYFGARYYMAAYGRWMSPDPMADKYPSWSPYNYVFNNPVGIVDPHGRDPFPSFSVFGLFDTVLLAKAVGGDKQAWKTRQAVRVGMTVAAASAGGLGPAMTRMAMQNPAATAAGAKEAVDFGMGLVADAPDPEGFGGGTLGRGARRLVGEAGDAARDAFSISTRQAQKKFKHAGDFGIQGNPNKEKLAQFKGAIMEHVSGSSTQVIEGSYRGQSVTHFYDPSTGVNVMKDADGNFVSGWKLSDQQREHLIRSGSLGGG